MDRGTVRVKLRFAIFVLVGGWSVCVCVLRLAASVSQSELSSVRRTDETHKAVSVRRASGFVLYVCGTCL